MKFRIYKQKPVDGNTRVFGIPNYYTSEKLTAVIKDANLFADLIGCSIDDVNIYRVCQSSCFKKMTVFFIDNHNYPHNVLEVDDMWAFISR